MRNSPIRRSRAWLHLRMVHLGVHVGVEAVLPRVLPLPRRERLLLDEPDADNRLDALEPVLPGDDQTERRPVLVGQGDAVQPDGEDRERVHRLVQAQPLDVRPLEDRVALARHLSGVVQRGELDELRAGVRLGALDHAAQGEAHPWDHHRPAFHAPEPVDALFERVRLHEVLELVVGRLQALAIHAHRPGPGSEAAGIPGRVGLVGPELVEVVVGGDVLVGSPGLRRAEGSGSHARQRRRPLPRPLPLTRLCAAGMRGGRRRDPGSRERDELAAPEVQPLFRDLRRRDLLLSRPEHHGGPSPILHVNGPP